MARSIRRLALAGVVALAGCALFTPTVRDGADADSIPGVALLLEGTAFKTAGAREEAAGVVATALGRPVRVLAGEPTLERSLGAAGTRLGRPFDRSAKTEARVAACRKQRSVAVAIDARADVLVRVRLDAKTRTRKATDAERADLARRPGLTGVLSSVGIGVGDTVFETKLDGTLERTTFPGTPTSVRRTIRAADRRLGRADAAPPPSVRAAIDDAVRALPAASSPRWEPLARGLVTAGCPVLGAAVGDVFLGDAASRRRVRSAATAALTPAVAKRDDPAADPPQSEDVGAAPADPAPVVVADPVPEKPEPVTACSNLCSLQMIELCNNDRSLWSQYGIRWEDTRCGLRRGESFLADCYRMQWLSGTYERACVHPCEESDEGRLRLVTMLRRSGCIRSGG